jgi:hypothetical protein
MWPPFLLIGIWMAPESKSRLKLTNTAQPANETYSGPWWLVRKGRMEDAKTSLLRLNSDEIGG